MFAAMIRYGFVSVAALAVDVGILRVLTEVAGLHYMIGASAGFGCGLIVNYALSRKTVFGAAGPMQAREFLMFAGVGALTLVLTLGIMSLLVETFGVNYLVAKAAAVGLSFVSNFALRRRFVFGQSAKALRIPSMTN